MPSCVSASVENATHQTATVNKFSRLIVCQPVERADIISLRLRLINNHTLICLSARQQTRVTNCLDRL